MLEDSVLCFCEVSLSSCPHYKVLWEAKGTVSFPCGRTSMAKPLSLSCFHYEHGYISFNKYSSPLNNFCSIIQAFQACLLLKFSLPVYQPPQHIPRPCHHVNLWFFLCRYPYWFIKQRYATCWKEKWHLSNTKPYEMPAEFHFSPSKYPIIFQNSSFQNSNLFPLILKV